MWNRATSSITETAREVLGILRGWAGWHKGNWWCNEKVKKKVEIKKEAYVKLIDSKDEEEKGVNRKAYKVARKEAKLAVMAAKSTVFESLYAELEVKDGEKRLYRIAKTMEWKGQDLDQVKYIKGKDGSVLVEGGDRGIMLGGLEHSEESHDFRYCRRFKVKKVKEAIHMMHRGRATGPNKISMDFWKYAVEADLSSLFRELRESKIHHVYQQENVMADRLESFVTFQASNREYC
ncbi:uncharacterized protein LOC107852830 [Capsicum annuum]|uniref:uncharacterized protein LOC107852830 n=1 Tax=Capsicum annuum TaxID=4072 RepID=UPI0007BFEB8E|nr:uncharacterized protein LOC107852830 [Capsicum annuum]